MSTVFIFRRPNEAIDWIGLTSIAASIIYATYIHHYVIRLERIGCDCATDFRRAYIQWYTLALIVIGIINVALRITGGDLGLSIVSMVLSPIMLAATIVYVVFVIQYINRLRREKCRCSESIARAILYIVTIIHVTLLCLLALVFLSMVLAQVGRKK